MLLHWIESFLAYRFQSARIGSCLMPICRVLSGVPQGSSLGPELLILFVNNTAECMDENIAVKLFADDTKIYTVIIDGKTSSNQLQHSLDLVVSLAEHWQLKLSLSRSSVTRKTSGRSVADGPDVFPYPFLLSVPILLSPTTHIFVFLPM
jgi:Reverse transcriptase (RNA-dependent DNA polymerase)